MAKKYFLVTNPDKKSRVINAETKFEAIAIATGKDNSKFVFKDYKVKNCK